MSEPKCPRDPSHTGFVVYDADIPPPHHAALLCAECHEHIKWLSQADTNRYAKERLGSEPGWCPFRNERCNGGGCQLWWLCDDDGVLARYVAMMTYLSTPEGDDK